ncbi:MAG: T9SS type A sorting domain-containing protein [Bacteroidales bacterium]|nr:T9SS type A sorting domain-containing protein [Bacteroidales bacterium]MCF8343624.1 T9SS type A sorting domain-containing protein [Bacteroidales bacterium]MCF8350110.1 T9SS type A sorting domain-containing protein [Bacteroidales bacterium]MCF8376168.1 T9SS type A sorting domain-containing protein [Bacteroidales bacterium]
MKTKIYLIFTVLFIAYSSLSSQDFQWAESAGGHGSDQAYAMVTDISGNSYVTGWFSDTADFGGIELVSDSLKDIFLAKYDSLGSLLWVKHAPGKGSNTAAGIAMDADGNVFITGWFEEIVSFDDIQLECHGLCDMFVAKYDPEGNAIWAKKAAGEHDIYGNRITVNAEGDVIVSGSFRGEVEFMEEHSFASLGDRDIFIALYHNNGAFSWAKHFGGMGEDRAYGIETDGSGNIVFTGFFNGICHFGEFELYSPAITSVYLAKMDASGDIQWISPAFGGANDFARAFGIGIDDHENIYTAGFFSGHLNLDYQDVLHASGGQFDFDVYIASYHPNGLLRWANKAGGAHMDQGRDLFVDGEGNSYLTGFFNGSAGFGDLEMESLGMADVFVASYDANGGISWAKSAGGAENDYGYSLGLDQNNNVYLCGIFTEEALFGQHSIDGWAGHDIFVAKISGTGSGIMYGNFIHKISLYPNPAGKQFSLNIERVNDEQLKVLITDVSGRIIEKRHAGNSLSIKGIIFNTAGYENGTYLVNVYSEKGMYSEKIIIKH